MATSPHNLTLLPRKAAGGGRGGAQACVAGVQDAVLHYRPLNNKLDWASMPMQRTADGFEACVPAGALPCEWDCLYYLELLTDVGGWLWPSWEDGAPYFWVRRRRRGLADISGGTRLRRFRD